MNAASIASPVLADPGAATPAGATPACAHCGLPVPPAFLCADAERQFCCNGCRAVYDVIRSCGLDRYYRLRQLAETDGRPARVTGSRFAEFDDPAFLAAYSQAGDDGLRAIDLLLEGVHCGACVWLIERLPTIATGVLEARLQWHRSRLHLVWNPQRTTLSALARALDSLGYTPHPARGARIERQRGVEDRRYLVRIAIAAAAAGNAMLLALALYAGAHSGMEPAIANLLRWTSALVGLISVAWPGSVFFRGAWAAIRARSAHIDVPISLGLGVGAVSGAVNTVRATGEIYFDSITMLVFLLLCARWIQNRQQRRAAQAVELLFAVTPTRARRVRDGAIEEVAIEALRPGDLVEVRARESAPVDGVVVEGESLIEQAVLTGESAPAPISVGGEMHAGAVSLTGRLLIEARAAGEQTRVGRLMKLVEDSLRAKAPIVHLADRLSATFIRALIVLATITLALWLWIDPARATERTVALLIVACPCALGLATPLAIAVSIGRAAQRGILIKGGAALEQLSRAGALVLDKTGTVTRGRMTLARWHGPHDVLPLAAALERHASHPIARAICDAVHEADLPAVEEAEHSASGIRGIVAGRRVAIGSRAFVSAQAASEPEWVSGFARSAADDGLTPVFVGVDGEIAAAAALGDELRRDSADAVDRFRAAGWDVMLLSGDHADVVSRVGERLRIPADHAHGGASPESKLAFVRELARHRPVVMVGDGVNDAAALAAAHVGIAVHGGAEASFAAADVYLNREGLGSITELLGAARSTIRAIRRCLFASLLYNTVGVGLAMTGFITPLVAALLMPISSLTVVSLALGARTFGSGRCR